MVTPAADSGRIHSTPADFSQLESTFDPSKPMCMVNGQEKLIKAHGTKVQELQAQLVDIVTKQSTLKTLAKAAAVIGVLALLVAASTFALAILAVPVVITLCLVAFGSLVLGLISKISIKKASEKGEKMVQEAQKKEAELSQQLEKLMQEAGTTDREALQELQKRLTTKDANAILTDFNKRIEMILKDVSTNMEFYSLEEIDKAIALEESKLESLQREEDYYVAPESSEQENKLAAAEVVPTQDVQAIKTSQKRLEELRNRKNELPKELNAKQIHLKEAADDIRKQGSLLLADITNRVIKILKEPQTDIVTMQIQRMKGNELYKHSTECAEEFKRLFDQFLGSIATVDEDLNKQTGQRTI